MRIAVKLKNLIIKNPLLDSFRSDLLYISKIDAVSSLVFDYSNKLINDKDFFEKEIATKMSFANVIPNNKQVDNNFNILQLEDIYRDNLYNNEDLLEQHFKDKYGFEIQHEQNNMLSFKCSNIKFLNYAMANSVKLKNL